MDENYPLLRVLTMWTSSIAHDVVLPSVQPRRRDLAYHERRWRRNEWISDVMVAIKKYKEWRNQIGKGNDEAHLQKKI